MASQKPDNRSASRDVKRRLLDAGFSIRQWANRRGHPEASVRSALNRGKWPASMLVDLAVDLKLSPREDVAAIARELNVKVTRGMSKQEGLRESPVSLSQEAGSEYVAGIFEQLLSGDVADDSTLSPRPQIGTTASVSYALCVQAFDGFIASTDSDLAARIVHLLDQQPTYRIYFFLGRRPDHDEADFVKFAKKIYQNLEDVAEPLDDHHCESIFQRVYVTGRQVASSFMELVSRAMAILSFTESAPIHEDAKPIQLHIGVDTVANRGTLYEVRFTPVNLQNALVWLRPYVREQLVKAKPIKECLLCQGGES